MIRVIIANQSKLVGNSIQTVLNAEDDIYVLGCAPDAEQLRFLIPQGDLVLIGESFEGANTPALIQKLQQEFEDVKILVFGVSRQVSEILAYLEGGTNGYILEDEEAEDLLAKIRAAVEGKAYVSPQVAAAMMERISTLAQSSDARLGLNGSRLEQLTPRQREVLQLVSKGMTNQEIAKRLYIQCGTVKNHVHHVLKKMGVRNRHEASSIYQLYQQSNGNGKGVVKHSGYAERPRI